MQLSKEALAWTVGVLSIGASLITANQLDVFGTPPPPRLLLAAVPSTSAIELVQWDEPTPAAQPLEATPAQLQATASAPTPAVAPVVAAPAPSLAAPALAAAPAPALAAAPRQPVPQPTQPAHRPRLAKLAQVAGSGPGASPTPTAPASPSAPVGAAPDIALTLETTPLRSLSAATEQGKPGPLLAVTAPPVAPASGPPSAPLPSSPAVATGPTPPPATPPPAAPPTTTPTTLPTTTLPTTTLPTTTLPTTTLPLTTLPPSTAPPPTTTPGFVISVTPSAGTVAAAAGPLSYAVGNAGTVIVQAAGGVLTLLAVIPSPGVVASVTGSSQSAVSVTFMVPGAAGTASCALSLSGSSLTYQIQG